VRLLHLLSIGFLLSGLLTACLNTPPEERGKVYCPDCGGEVEALYETHFDLDKKKQRE
jgi:hypothetical protein